MYSSIGKQNQHINPSKSSGPLSFLRNSYLPSSNINFLKANIKNLEIYLANQDHQYTSLSYFPLAVDRDMSCKEEKIINLNSLRQQLNPSNGLNIFLFNLFLNLKGLKLKGKAERSGEGIIGKLDRENYFSMAFGGTQQLLMLGSKSELLNGLENWEARMALLDQDEDALIQLQMEDKKLKKTSSELRSWLTSFGAAFCAGTIARTSTAPFDRLKFIYQLYYKGSDKPPSLSMGLKEIYRRDGFRGLFRGNLVCILKASPESSIRLTVFEKLKSLIKDEKTKELSKGKLFLAGGLSGVIANLAIFPMDVIRTRLAGAPNGVYNGMIDAVKKIARTEGRIRPFYKGVNAAQSVNLPTSGFNLMIYETLKERLMTHWNKKQLPGIVYMALGGISALLTISMLYPLQVVTSRLIMHPLLDKESDKKGMKNQIKKIYHSEGVRGFYKGYCPATSKVILGNAMLFGCFEFMKKVFGIEFKKH
jgi:solute carrier family 25 phosphate transporter 23/24/25/41